MNGLEVCPKCGCEYEPGKLYTLREIAKLVGVVPNTVSGWIRDGKLQCYIYARGSSSFVRVVRARDFIRFIDSKLVDPRVVDDSLGSRIWHWRRHASSLGGKAKAAKRRAKLQAQAASVSDPQDQYDKP